MRVLFWYCDKFAWTPTIKTLDQVPISEPDGKNKVVVTFVHIEPKDVEPGSSSETKLVKMPNGWPENGMLTKFCSTLLPTWGRTKPTRIKPNSCWIACIKGF